MERLRKDLHKAGFDIFHGPFSPKLYNDALERDGLVESGTLSKLPEVSDGSNEEIRNVRNTRDASMDAYLIGNTKHLWPIFVRWLWEESNHHKRLRTLTQHNKGQNIHDGTTQDNFSEDASCNNVSKEFQLAFDDPLDTYEQTIIETLVRKAISNQNGKHHSSCCGGGGYFLYYSSELEPSRMVSMARVASCSGFSFLDQDTHLSIHPVYGTWHSYRAVLLVPSPTTTGQPLQDGQLPKPISSNPLTNVESKLSKDAFEAALRITTKDKDRLCLELGEGIYDDCDASQKSNRKHKVAAAWIRMRDSVSIGRETYRFGPNQLWYHYTKDEKYLFREFRGILSVRASSADS